MRSCNLKTRISLCAAILRIRRKHTPVLFMTCGRCGGIAIRNIEEYDSDHNKEIKTVADLEYLAKHICLKCGAVCREVQMWTWEDGGK